MATYWMRSTARGVALATCILLPTLCGCVATPANFDDGWVFGSSETPAPKSKPAATPRSESTGDSSSNPVVQVGGVDPQPLFPGTRRSEPVR